MTPAGNIVVLQSELGAAPDRTGPRPARSRARRRDAGRRRHGHWSWRPPSVTRARSRANWLRRWASSSSRAKAALSLGWGTALRAERARAEPARSRGGGCGCRQPCGAARLRVAAAHESACVSRLRLAYLRPAFGRCLLGRSNLLVGLIGRCGSNVTLPAQPGSEPQRRRDTSELPASPTGRKPGEAGLAGGELMRRGDAQPRRAARLTTTANPNPWSARARPARVQREAPYPTPSESAAFARVFTSARASGGTRGGSASGC